MTVFPGGKQYSTTLKVPGRMTGCLKECRLIRKADSRRDQQRNSANRGPDLTFMSSDEEDLDTEWYLAKLKTYPEA